MNIHELLMNVHELRVNVTSGFDKNVYFLTLHLKGVINYMVPLAAVCCPLYGAFGSVCRPLYPHPVKTDTDQCTVSSDHFLCALKSTDFTRA